MRGFAGLLLGLWVTLNPADPARAAERSLASACQLDFQLFCADVDPQSGRAEVAACLAKNREILTEECRAVLDPASRPKAGSSAKGPFGGVCQEDFRRLCSQAGDRMAFARCVRNHHARLSQPCQEALAARGGPGASGAKGRGGRRRP